MNLTTDCHKGATVEFRCGGTAVVEAVEPLGSATDDRVRLKFRGFEIANVYLANGHCFVINRTHPFDIVEVRAAPPAPTGAERLDRIIERSDTLIGLISTLRCEATAMRAAMAEAPPKETG